MRKNSERNQIHTDDSDDETGAPTYRAPPQPAAAPPPDAAGDDRDDETGAPTYKAPPQPAAAPPLDAAGMPAASPAGRGRGRPRPLDAPAAPNSTSVASVISRKLGIKESIVRPILQEFPDAVAEVLQANGKVAVANMMAITMAEKVPDSREEFQFLHKRARQEICHSDNLKILYPAVTLKTSFRKKLRATKDVLPKVLEMPMPETVLSEEDQERSP